MSPHQAGHAGRPRQFDVDDLVGRTLELFWNNGYRSTSTRDLEHALGVSQSSLYHAFGSKSGLLETVLDRYQQAVDRTLLEPLRTTADGSAALAAYARAVVTSAATEGRGCLMVTLGAEAAPGNPAVEARARAHRARLRAALHAAIDRLPGTAGPDTLASRTELLLAASLGVNVAARGGASSAELEEMGAAMEAEIASWTE